MNVYDPSKQSTDSQNWQTGALKKTTDKLVQHVLESSRRIRTTDYSTVSAQNGSRISVRDFHHTDSIYILCPSPSNQFFSDAHSHISATDAKGRCQVKIPQIVGVLRSIYRRNCALFEESMKVSMDRLWVILNKFRGGHKWNMQISGRVRSRSH